jgi:beta-1,4-mannosyl-glycoprotein beta-1,4-N-acetylglucosaminyltransferase
LTFSGLKKPLYYLENKARYERFKEKIVHCIIPDSRQDIEKEIIDIYFTDEAKSFSHKHSGRSACDLKPSVQREIFQRDSLVIPLIGLAKTNDIILLSDVDEIPYPKAITSIKKTLNNSSIYHFKQKWYSYWINNRVESEWFGTRAFIFSNLSDYSVDYHRFPTESRSQQIGIIIEDGGWHFSYLGGEQAIKLKLSSLAYQGFRANITNMMMSIFPGYIKKKINKNGDILRKGRKFSRVNIDDTFPETIRNDLAFITKYSIE